MTIVKSHNTNVLIITLLLSACATNHSDLRPRPPTQAPVQDKSVTAQATPQADQINHRKPRKPHTIKKRHVPFDNHAANNAANTLLQHAELSIQQGHLNKAAAQLERALRIDPKSAALWYKLADVRYQQGKLDLAANLALKSNRFAGPDISLKIENLRIISEAKTRMGNLVGAEQAAMRAIQLKKSMEN